MSSIKIDKTKIIIILLFLIFIIFIMNLLGFNIFSQELPRLNEKLNQINPSTAQVVKKNQNGSYAVLGKPVYAEINVDYEPKSGFSIKRCI